MKGTNDTWNMCINQGIVKGWLFRAELVKGDNSRGYTLIDNALRDVCIPKTTERILMKITLRLYQATRLLLKIKLSRSIQDKPICSSCIVKQ